MTMNSTPEQLRLARSIGFETWKNRAVAWREREGIPCPQEWLDTRRRAFGYGWYDGEDTVQSALAAIIETTELAAKMVESRWEDGAYISLDLRNGEHLKGTPNDQ